MFGDQNIPKKNVVLVEERIALFVELFVITEKGFQQFVVNAVKIGTDQDASLVGANRDDFHDLMEENIP